MKEIALEDLVASTILSFCENAAELGCPQKATEVDMWYRCLKPDDQRIVAGKLLDIIERDAKKLGKENSKRGGKK